MSGPVRVAAELELPLEPLEFADGTVLTGIVPFTLRMHQMYEALQTAETTDGILALLRRCLPGASDDTLLDLSDVRIWLVFEHARRRLAQTIEAVEAHRKNGDAGVEPDAASPRPPSSPMTNTSTPSPASRGRSGRTGGRSTTNRSTAPSTPSTA